MISYDIAKIVIQLFEQAQKPGFPLSNWRDDRNAAFYSIVELSARNCGYSFNKEHPNLHNPQWENSYRSCVHFIIVPPHRAYCAVSASNVLPQASEFKFLSNHDSCWNSEIESVITREVFKVDEIVFEHMPAEHRPSTKTSEVVFRLSSKSSLIQSDPYRIVSVDYVRAEYRHGISTLHAIRIPEDVSQ